ncbi:MAG: DNA-binding domain-containing protein [Pseudomonadota bacterium]
MLHQLQTTFQNSLTSYHNNQFLKHIRPNPKTPVETQLALYRNSIIARFQKALKATYPVCQQLVGDDFFLAMAREFIEVTVSRSPDLNDYGKDFPDFINTFPPTQSLPYLADTTRLEWAWHQITGAPDQTSFDYKGLAACYEAHGERIIFTLPQRSTLLASLYPVHQIWESNQKNYQGDNTITLAADQQYYFLIWRDQSELRIDHLNEREWYILNLVTRLIPLAEVCEQASSVFPEVDVAALLSNWVKSGWIAGFIVN